MEQFTKAELRTLLMAMGAEIDRMTQGDHYQYSSDECADASLYNRLHNMIESMPD